jgi:hypothetical protein
MTSGDVSFVHFVELTGQRPHGQIVNEGENEQERSDSPRFAVAGGGR